MNECTKMHGFREKKLFSKNTKRSTLQPLFPFVNRGTAVRWAERGERRQGREKRKTSFSLIRNQKAFSHSLCAPRGHSEPVSVYIRLGHFDEIKAQASLWLNRMGALTQPVSD